VSIAAGGAGSPSCPSGGAAVQDAAAPRPAEDTGYAWRALSVVSLASILIALNGSAVTTALPVLVAHFHTGDAVGSWILLSYLLVSTVLTLVWGRCADLLGRRFMYIVGLAVYTAVALALGLAPSVGVVIALRALQGAASAALLTNSAAIVSSAFPQRLLSRGMGIYMASFSVATLLGPTLGGLLVTSFGWRWVFWFNVPVGLTALIWGIFTLRPNPRTERFTGLDLGGNALFAVGLGGLLVALSEGGSLGWGSPVVLVGLAAFAVAIPTFIRVEMRGRSPVIDPRMFRDRPFAMANSAAFINVLARSGIVVMVALYFQAVRGDTPLRAGIAVLPLTAATALGSVLLGRLSRFAQPRMLAAVGSGIASLGLLELLVTCSRTTSYPLICAGIVLVGFGSGLFMPANITSILATVPPDRLGITNAVRLMLQNSAMVVGTAACLTLLAVRLPGDERRAVYASTISSVSGPVQDLLADGYRITYGFMFVLSLVGVFMSLASRRVHQRLAPAREDQAVA
jgi:EmrB/QacA subfamily drug resistance transporter